MSSEPPDKNKSQPEETTPNPFQQSINASGGSSIENVSQTINVITRSETEELNDFLDKAMADFESRMAGLLADLLLDAAPPEEPFKSLEYFKPGDASIFFGRSATSRELYDKLVDNRLLILYARSGAGKSSILNAGLTPLLLRENRLPVYVRIQSFEDDLVLEIKQAIFPLSRSPWPKVVHGLSLHEFLSYVSNKRQRTKELVVILDQFEQFLISLPNKDIHQKFIEILRDCYEDEYLPVRFIISLKHENLGDLDAFEQYIPGILQNRYRLLPMSEEEVKEAITKPVQKVNPAISFEPALLDTLIRELGGKNVELTHLQIVCSQLYSKLPSGEKEITTRFYEEQGRVNQILSSYLDETLEPLPEYKHKVARSILLELVGSEGTNRILRLPDFEKVVDPDPSVIENVLEYLVNKHLLRRDMDPEEKRYELAHDYLAHEISKLLGEEQLESKRAQDLLQRALVNWRLFQILIDPGGLNILRGHLQVLSLDKEAQECLLDSSLAHAHDIAFWIDQTQDKHAAARKAATSALANYKVAVGLKDGLAKDLQADVLSVLRETYNSSDSTRKRQLAETIWVFRDWLSREELSSTRWALLPSRIRRTARERAVPLLVTTFVIVLAMWYVFFVEHPLAGNWLPIPAGPFVMGMNDKEAAYAYQSCLDGAINKEDCQRSTPDLLREWSGRQKGASLKQYKILENEVTFAQYQQCVDGQQCEELVDVPPENRGINLPATTLNWLQAEAYCEWLGGRLPSEGEWEKAARGADGNFFPWGTLETWDESKANIEHKGEGSVAKVFQFAETDLSPYGVLNMAGNVREWTSTECLPESCWKKEGEKFSNSFMTTQRAREGGTPKPVILRGGHWENARSQGIASQRAFGMTNERAKYTGFRCVCPDGATCKAPWTWWWVWLRLK